MSFEMFTPIWPHVNDKKDIYKKVKKKKKYSGDIMDRYFPPRFGINLLDGFWENGFYEQAMGG